MLASISTGVPKTAIKYLFTGILEDINGNINGNINSSINSNAVPASNMPSFIDIEGPDIDAICPKLANHYSCRLQLVHVTLCFIRVYIHWH